ncbi:MAG: WD40 repeat domain-containing protein [Gemmataceae bacterium]
MPLSTIALVEQEPKGRRDAQWMALLEKGRFLAVRYSLPKVRDEPPDGVVEIYETATGKRAFSEVVRRGGQEASEVPPRCAVSLAGDWLAFGSKEVQIRNLPNHQPNLPGWVKKDAQPPVKLLNVARLWVGEADSLYVENGVRFDGRYSLERWVQVTGKDRFESQQLLSGGDDTFAITAVDLNPLAGKFAVALQCNRVENKPVIECWAFGEKQKPEKKTIALDVSASALAVSPNGKTIAAGFKDGSVVWFETASGKATRRWLLGGSTVGCVVFHPTGELVACSTLDGKGKLNVFCLNLLTGEKVSSFVGDETHVSLICFSLDGERLATFGMKGIKIWETGALLQGKKD